MSSIDNVRLALRCFGSDFSSLFIHVWCEHDEKRLGMCQQVGLSSEVASESAVFRQTSSCCTCRRRRKRRQFMWVAILVVRFIRAFRPRSKISLEERYH